MNFSRNHILIALGLIGLSLGAFYYYNNQSNSVDAVEIQRIGHDEDNDVPGSMGSEE